jgi:hypothetical protein
VYFSKPDGSELLSVPHTASTETQFVSLFTPAPGTKINAFEPAGNRLVIEASSADGTQGGVLSIPRTGGAPTTLESNNTAPSTVRLGGTAGPLVLINRVAGTASLVYTASAIQADGSGATGGINDAQWAGETFQASCDFNEGCEESAAASALYLRRQASTSQAELEIADPATGTPTGTYVGSVFGASEGPAAFVLGFGDYGQVTVFAASGQSDLFLADGAQAAASPPASALLTVANAPGAGDNRWLLFGDGDGAGGGGSLDSDFDGLADSDEIALGTDPFNPDTDGDGLGDGEEFNTQGTNPLLSDTDGDGLDDGFEVFNTGTDPLSSDTDADDVGDLVEFEVGTDAISTQNTVIYVDPLAGCSPCDGTSWATAWPDETSVSGANAPSGTDSLNVTYVLFAGGAYGPLDLTGVDRKHVAYVGSVGPGLPTPVFPPTTFFSGSGTQRAATISQSVEVVLSFVGLVNGFDAAVGGGVYLGSTVNTEFLQNTVHLLHVQVATSTSGDSGGGVAAEGSTTFLFIDQSEVTGNNAQGGTSATARGGGVLAFNGADIDITRTLVAGNIASCALPSCLALGGGVAASGGLSSLAIGQSVIENNTASTSAGSAMGGGVGADTSANASMTGTEVRNNTATVTGSGTAAGGGIGSNGAGVQVSSSGIRGNTASGGAPNPPFGGGGGLYVDAGGGLDLFGSVVADNKAPAGPGGGANLVNTSVVIVSDSKFLSNSSSNPGGGLHLHPQSPSDLFNNLFVGNVSTNAVTDGGAIEIENLAPASGVSFNSNTVAWNQTPNNATDAGGGVSLSGTMDFRNNIVWFNQNSSPGTTDTGDNMRFDGSIGGSTNNVQDPGMPGSTPANPLFVQGFFLDPLGPSPSIDAGGDAFAGPLLGGGYTTDPAGASDASPLDIGFHYDRGSAGPFDSVALTPSRTLSCASTDTFVFTPSFANAAAGEPGHLIVVELAGVTPTLGSLMTIDPRGTGSRVARDLGDGRYAVTTSGFQSGSATGTFTVYADDQPTPRTFTITFTNAC